jgi:hypothetical protein
VIFVLFFSIYFNYAVPLIHVGCQCDAVVLIKIVIFFAFLFPFILITMQSPTHTRRCQCDAVVLIHCDFVCFLFPFYFNYAVHAPYTGKMSV